MIRRIKTLSQAGDTIVEVLIATAVVSLVLAGAFAIANISLKQIRMAQERTEAQKYAQGSIEKLDGFVETPANRSLMLSASAPSPFCIATGGLYRLATDPQCTTGRYQTTITRATADKTFTVTVTWTNVKGEIETVPISYRTRLQTP